MTVSSRREREQQMRRECIIEAAQLLFERKGYEPTTVEEIAETAELGKGTIYSYFKSKEEIYIAILEKRLDTLIEQMKTAIREPKSAVDALQRLYDTFVVYYRERKGFVASLFVQADEQVFYRLGGLVSGLKNKAAVWMDLVGQVLQWGIERGEFVPMDVPKTARIVVGLILGLIIQHDMGQIDSDLISYRDEVFDLVLKGLRC